MIVVSDNFSQDFSGCDLRVATCTTFAPIRRLSACSLDDLLETKLLAMLQTNSQMTFKTNGRFQVGDSI